MVEDIQDQIKEQQYKKEIMQHGWDIQQWKFETCFNEDSERCQNCVSKGTMLWVFCSDMEDEYDKKFNSDLVKE